MQVAFANDDRSTLAVAMGVDDTTLTVATGTGALFPVFETILVDSEIMWITDISGDVFTVSRANEPRAGVQVASTHAVGANVIGTLTAGVMNNLPYLPTAGGTVTGNIVLGASNDGSNGQILNNNTSTIDFSNAYVLIIQNISSGLRFAGSTISLNDGSGYGGGSLYLDFASVYFGTGAMWVDDGFGGVVLSGGGYRTGFFNVNPNNAVASMGDVDGFENNTYVKVDDNANSFTIQANDTYVQNRLSVVGTSSFDNGAFTTNSGTASLVGVNASTARISGLLYLGASGAASIHNTSTGVTTTDASGNSVTLGAGINGQFASSGFYSGITKTAESYVDIPFVSNGAQIYEASIDCGHLLNKNGSALEINFTMTVQGTGVSSVQIYSTFAGLIYFNTYAAAITSIFDVTVKLVRTSATSLRQKVVAVVNGTVNAYPPTTLTGLNLTGGNGFDIRAILGTGGTSSTVTVNLVDIKSLPYSGN